MVIGASPTLAIRLTSGLYVSMYVYVRTSLPPEAPNACAHARAVVLIPAHLCVVKGFFFFTTEGGLEANHTYARYM